MATSFSEIAQRYWHNIESLREYAQSLRPAAFERHLEVLDELVPILTATLGQTSEAPEGIREVVNLVTQAAEVLRAAVKANRNAEQDSEDISTDVPEGSGAVARIDVASSGKIKQTSVRELLEVIRKLSVSSRIPDLLHRSSLITLISFFELLLADLLRIYFHLRPQALSGDDKILSFNEIKSFSTLEELTEHFVARRIDAIMRESLDDWKLFLLKQLKIDLTSLSPSGWDKVVEVFERRNLLVHNDGKINEVYLRKVGDGYLSTLKSRPELGQTLAVSARYLDEALDLFTVIGLRLIHGCWVKLEPDDADARERLLWLDIVYQLMLSERWWIVRHLCKYAIEQGCSMMTRHLVNQVNYWLAMKRMGQANEVASEINTFDTGACHPRYAIAIHSLRDDSTNFFRDLPAAVKGGVSKNDLLEWPVLAEMRCLPEFDGAIQREFAQEWNEPDSVVLDHQTDSELLEE